MTITIQTLNVVLNGTPENPFEKWGLSQNPFPQIGSHERQAACLALQKLAGAQITSEQYIRQTLYKHFAEDFINLIVSHYVPGKRVEFTVNFPSE